MTFMIIYLVPKKGKVLSIALRNNNHHTLKKICPEKPCAILRDEGLRLKNILNKYGMTDRRKLPNKMLFFIFAMFWMLLNFLSPKTVLNLLREEIMFYTIQNYMIRIIVSANKDLKLIASYIKQVGNIGFKLS